MTRKLEVMVVGTACSGKTALCEIIADALEKHGITVNVKLLDNMERNDITHLAARVSSIASLHDAVTIHEVQALRHNGK